MSIEKKVFGQTPEGTLVPSFTLKNAKGMEAKILTLGGIIVSLRVPDKDGNLEDVVLGYDHLEPYLKKGPFFGALIGRHGNRIQGASFELNGVTYSLYKNEGENHLHGGLKGFDKVLWEAEVVDHGAQESLELTYLSKDGEEGYPGNLQVKVTYTLTEDNSLQIEYLATTDQDTVVNLTNHTYFNLSGHRSGDVLGHKLMINGDQFTVNDQSLLPTGEIRSVQGTPLDFTALTLIGQGISSDYEQIAFANGYDHNWILNTDGDLTKKAAEVYDEASGRVMEMYTTKPGVQFYSGNFLDGSDIGKDGVVYHKNAGLCLETQYFPNALKHEHFPSPILRKGDTYNHTTIYKFLNR